MAWVKLAELAEAIRPLMSALPPIPTELMHHNEPSLRANKPNAAQQKSLLNRLVGARERRWRHVERDSRNESYGISSAADTELLSLDVGSPDHLGPLLGFLSHQLSEFGRRHRHGLAAELGQTSLQLRVGQSRVHRLI